MSEDKKKVKKKVAIAVTGSDFRSGRNVGRNGGKRGGGSGGRSKSRSKERPSRYPREEKSVTDLINELKLDDLEKENFFDPLSFDDIRRKPDLWMAAFDNPVDFIEFCQKKINHERELLEKSRQVENEIHQFVQDWSRNTEKHAQLLDDLYKVQDINDKLQEVIMEERTHCKHLVGLNDKLETERQILERKYSASLLLGKVEDRAVNHLLERNPKAVPLADKLSRLNKEIKSCEGHQNLLDVADPTVLAGRVTSLEKYIEDLKRQHREEVNVLKDTVSQGNLKCESVKAQYTDLLKRNAKSLDEVKEVLNASLRENLNLRRDLLKKDTEFMELHSNALAQKPKKSSYSHLFEPNMELRKTKSEEITAVDREYQVRLAKSEIELGKKSNLLRDALQKILVLERKCARLEEENHVLKRAHEHSVKALKSKNDVLMKRCEKTESRVKLEYAGLLSEIRQCKSLVKVLTASVRSFKREQAALKKKISDSRSQISVGVQLDTPASSATSVDDIRSATTQTKYSELQLHAMNLWVNYVQSKVSEVEQLASAKVGAGEPNNNNEEEDEDVRVMFMNRTIMEESMERIRDLADISEGYRADSSGDMAQHSLYQIDEQDSIEDLPPFWVQPSRKRKTESNIALKGSRPNLRGGNTFNH